MGRKVEVFYDGHCPFCVASRDRIAALDAEHRLVFCDMNIASSLAIASPRFPADALAEQMHVLMPNGTWRVGYFAWVEIVRELPMGRVLASVLQFPPIAEVGHAAYKLIAANRHFMSRLLNLPPPCNSKGCALPAQSASNGVTIW